MQYIIICLIFAPKFTPERLSSTERQQRDTHHAALPTDKTIRKTGKTEKQTLMKTKNEVNISTLTLADINKSVVWDLQENDIIRLWNSAEKETDLLENGKHYVDIIRSAFEMEEIRLDRPEVVKKYESRGMTVAQLPYGLTTRRWGIKKRPIVRVTDLTYENIGHISAAKLLEIIDRNFGGGWESLSQSIRDIIESRFDISTTTLPKERLKNAGGIYEMKVNDGFDVLEISKGSWVEAIFAKAKPIEERHSFSDSYSQNNDFDDMEEDDEDYELPEDNYGKDEDEDMLDDDELTAESYRTTIEENPDDLDITVDDLDDEEY